MRATTRSLVRLLILVCSCEFVAGALVITLFSPELRVDLPEILVICAVLMVASVVTAMWLFDFPAPPSGEPPLEPPWRQVPHRSRTASASAVPVHAAAVPVAPAPPAVRRAPALRVPACLRAAARRRRVLTSPIRVLPRRHWGGPRECARLTRRVQR